MKILVVAWANVPILTNIVGFTPEPLATQACLKVGIQEGAVKTGITSPVGATTGAAPCWQCAPQPDTVNERTDKTIATDYGAKRDNFNKGTVQ